MKPGYGTLLNPLKMTDAMGYALIRDGHNVYIRGGVYRGDYVFTLSGVTVQPYPGEHPVIDGSLTINGSNTVFTDLEICYSGWENRTAKSGKFLTVNGAGCKVLNCHIHDLEGVGFWMSAIDAEMRGNIIHNIGWLGVDRGHGHAIYTQNDTGRKVIKNNIMFNCFGWGIHAYTEGGKINNFDIVGNINFNAGILSGALRDDILIGGQDAQGIVMDGNCTYGGRSGFRNYAAKEIVMNAKDNYFPNGWVTDGTVFETDINNVVGTVGDRVFVFQNGVRLHVAIYNQAEAATVDVDVSAVYANGDAVKVYNVQDYPNDMQELTVTAGVITVNMQAANRTIASPYAWTAPAKSFPQFGAFVVIKQ